VADHEGGLGGREVARGDDEVALILAVRRVEYDDELALGCVAPKKMGFFPLAREKAVTTFFFLLPHFSIFCSFPS
jgi:hypothetical protein